MYDYSKPCASQHFGKWAVEPKWISQAVASIKAGTWQAITIDEVESEEPSFTIEQGGVGVVPIIGQITKGSSSLGGASSVKTRKAIRSALADTSVKSILLHIDSPGGTVAGTDQLAQEVIRANGIKQVHAHIEDLGASAAFWIAAGASRITANATAEVGSIGTVAVVEDLSEMAKAEGVKVHVISTGAHKGAFVAGTEITDEQLSALQDEVDDINAIFLARVSEGRQLSGERLDAVSDGRVFIASKAKDMGLIDEVMSIEQAIGDMAKEGETTTEARMRINRRRC